MAIPVLRNWSVGELVTASMMNNYVRDVGDFWLDVPWVHMDNSANVSHTTSGSYQLLTFNTTLRDTDNMHPGSGGVFTVATTGIYQVHAEVMFAANLTGTRGLSVDRTRSGVSTTGWCRSGACSSYADDIATVDSVAFETSCQIDRMMSLLAGDELRFYGYQNSGGALNMLGSGTTNYYTQASIRWLGQL